MVKVLGKDIIFNSQHNNVQMIDFDNSPVVDSSQGFKPQQCFFLSRLYSERKKKKKKKKKSLTEHPPHL